MQDKYGYDEILSATPEEIEKRLKIVNENRNAAAQKRTSSRKIEKMKRKSMGIIERTYQETEEDYEKKQSIPVRKKERKVTLSRKDYIKRLKVVATLSAVLTIATLGGVKIVSKDFSDDYKIDHEASEFYREVVLEEKHPTVNHKYYYYDYSDIAQKIMESEDIEKSVYLLIESTDEEQTNLVLTHTPYKNLELFVVSRGYKDIKDFKSELKKRILIETEIKEKEQELDEMAKQHPTMQASVENERSKK